MYLFYLSLSLEGIGTLRGKDCRRITFSRGDICRCEGMISFRYHCDINLSLRNSLSRYVDYDVFDAQSTSYDLSE